MKNKIFQIVCLFIFFSLFWYFFGDEYWEYRDLWKQEQEYRESLNIALEGFQFENIEEFWDNIQLFHTPNLHLLHDIVKQIDKAKDKIYVEVYIFTERDMRDALIRAHRRWVDVKILLENNPYKAPYLNDKHYQAFKDVGIDVRWSDPLNYSLNHAKMMIIDQSVYISTGNFSYSLFKYNRDFLVLFRERDFVEKLEELFLWDFQHKNIWIYDENLVLSPSYSRDRLTRLISSAEETIDFYFPYIADDDFRDSLFDIAKSGVTIRGIVEEKFYKENSDMVSDFAKQGIALSPLKSDKLHAKAINVDDKYLYVGSINFSTYSFDENREIGLIIKDSAIMKNFTEIFESDL